MRALLLLACLTMIVPAVCADAADGTESQSAEQRDAEQGSYVCEAETSEASGSAVYVHEDPLTVAVKQPDRPSEDSRGGNYIGVSVYPVGNGPCVILALPAQ